MYATTGKAGRMARKGRTLGMVVGESSTSVYDYSLYPCSTYRLYHVNCQSIDWLVHTRAKLVHVPIVLPSLIGNSSGLLLLE